MPNAENIVAELLNPTASLPEKKMLVLYVFGPNTNWSVLEKLKTHRYKNKLPQILEVGCSSLHVVYGILQTGVKATGWELDRFLKALWNVLNDFPAKRNLDINSNTSDKFPLMFCQTKWAEHESIASGAIKVWPFVVNVVNHYQSLSKSKSLKITIHTIY